jgi:hypothetical protein
MKKIVFINLLCLILVWPVSAQRKYYVKTDGIPGLNASSWGWASNDLQATVDKAVAGDIVYVAAGTYYGGFILKEGVTVMGGYTANSSNPTERYDIMNTNDPAHQSILDGSGTQRTLTQLTPFSTPTTWNGFVIQNGNPSPEFKKGSIIYSTNGDNKIIGVLYKYDSVTKEGMMIGTESTKKQWGAYEKDLPALPVTPDRTVAKDDLSGLSHTGTILAALGNQCVDFSPENVELNGNYAAYWCDTLTTGGYTDWFLPSTGELREVYDADIKNVMTSLGKNLNFAYWTSSHAGDALAWAFCFGNGYFHPALKYVRYPVSAVHAFVMPEHPDGTYFAGGGAFLSQKGILENCIVKNNLSSSRGGGVYVGIDAQLINCIVAGNDAPEGKEIYYEDQTGIDSPVNEGLKIQVHPNPVKAGAIVRAEGNISDAAYQWVNTAGIVVEKGKWTSGSNSIPVPHQKGIFILCIQSENANCKLKIIIN